MTRQELHQALSEVIYIEDQNLVDTLLASVIANAIPLGDPVWLTIIGQSSGGKSQYIRPLAKSNPNLFIQLDDISENAFISGVLREKSILFNIKKEAPGIISMDDLTVLFSKNAEARNAVLAQFRMLYDGRLTRVFGNSKESPECTWEGFAGMIAGSTPAIYKHFAEVADMGERFVMYRMKDVDAEKMIDIVLANPLPVKTMDGLMADIYDEYIGSVLGKVNSKEIDVSKIVLDDLTMERIKKAGQWCTLLRTPVMLHQYGEYVEAIPVPESPLRVIKQLLAVAKSFMVMTLAEDPTAVELPSELRDAVEWVAYSIADDKRRLLYKAVLAKEFTPERATPDSLVRYTNMDKQFVALEMKKLNAIGIVSNDNIEGFENDFYTASAGPLNDMIGRLDPVLPPEERPVDN